MKFLVDAALSYVLANLLTEAEYDAVHVRHYDMTKAPDIEIFERAKIESRIIIRVDTDFSALLALTNSAKPSVILLRWPMLRRAEEQAAVIKANLSGIEVDLENGAVVTIEENRVRVRLLPIRK